jgi:hypothetical protein
MMMEDYAEVVAERDCLRAVVDALFLFLLACARADDRGKDPRTDPDAKAAHAALTPLLANLYGPIEGG